MGVRSHIGVQNVQKILFGEDKGQSHKTSRSHNRGSFVAGTTVLAFVVNLINCTLCKLVRKW